MITKTTKIINEQILNTEFSLYLLQININNNTIKTTNPILDLEISKAPKMDNIQLTYSIFFLGETDINNLFRTKGRERHKHADTPA